MLFTLPGLASGFRNSEDKQRVDPAQPWEAGKIAVGRIKHPAVFEGQCRQLRIGSHRPPRLSV